MNELLFVVTIIINFVGIILAYKWFGKTGLFVWIGFATVAANIEVSKCINMFGISATLGNVIYGTTFLATDILSEKYCGKEARKGVFVGFFTMIFFTVITQINLLFVPNEQDFVSEAMKTVFGLMPRLCISSMATYLFSNTLDTYLFDWIRKISPKHLWLRNNGSTIISQFFDSIVFNALAFIGVYPTKTIIEIIITTYVIKVVIALCDTPFMYLSRKIKDVEEEK